MNQKMLIIPILLPLLGGALLPLLRFSKQKYREWYIEILVILNTLFVFFLIINRPEDSITLLRFTGDLTITFQIDTMSSIFASLIALLWPFASLYAFEYMRKEERQNSFFMFYTMTYGITLGIAFSGNLLSLYMFYEILTLITVPLVMHSLSREARRSARKYLYYSIGGAAFAFIGLVFILTYGVTNDFILGGVLDVAKIGNKKGLLQFIYILSFLGFGVKAAVFPFHGWLPTASIAPTPVTALLHAVAVVKSGAFAILRITYFSFGADFLRGSFAQNTVMLFALVTILYGSSMAIKEVHFKRRLAYSTISNLSYILFAASIMTPLGLVGALTHMLFHGLIKICSFFCAGSFMHQTGREYISQIDGIGKKMPVTFGCFAVSSLALMGVPCLPGFISKWNIAAAAIESQNKIALLGVFILLFSAVLTAIYMITIVVKAFCQKEKEEISAIKDPNWYMKLPIIVFCIAMVILGTCSFPLIQLLEQAANGII